MLAAMVLAPDFYCEDCQRVISAMRGNPPLECDPFLNTAMQRFTCDLYYRFDALLAPVSVGIITDKHYAKNSITKLNDRSNNGTCDPATRNCNQTEEPSEN